MPRRCPLPRKHPSWRDHGLWPQTRWRTDARLPPSSNRNQRHVTSGPGHDWTRATKTMFRKFLKRRRRRIVFVVESQIIDRNFVLLVRARWSEDMRKYSFTTLLSSRINLMQKGWKNGKSKKKIRRRDSPSAWPPLSVVIVRTLRD